MAWEWSHTGEAYAAAEKNMRKMSVKRLTEIWAEWAVKRAETAVLAEIGRRKKVQERLEVVRPDIAEKQPDIEESAGWDDEVYKTALKEAKTIAKNRGKEHLADDIWGWVAEQATCDNGGFNAWCCPYGCGCHTVSFGP